MKLALILTAVEAETEEVVETGAAGGATNQLVFDPHVSSEGDLKSNQLEAHYNYAVGPLFYFVSASMAGNSNLQAVVVDCHFIPSQREQLLVDVGWINSWFR